MFGFLEYFFNFSIVVLLTKLNPAVVCWKPWPFSWIFVVKTSLIWLVLVGFFCVFSQSESICNLHSCYKFALVLQKSCTPFSAKQNRVIFSCILLRPITVVPVLFKVIEKLIGRHVADCIIFSQSLKQTIAGFPEGRSTPNELLHVRDDIIRAMKKMNLLLLMVLADYSKAFDTVSLSSRKC